MTKQKDTDVTGRYGLSRRSQVKILILGLLGLVAGCAASESERQAGQLQALAPAEARLIFNHPSLAEPATFDRFVSDNEKYTEETAYWTPTLDKRAEAGLLLSESQAGPPLADPKDPAVTYDFWPPFREKTPAFGRLIESSNDRGPLLWRRASVGTATCVLFVQHWEQLAPQGSPSPQATLSGYYCNPPGVTMSGEAAEAILGSVRLRAAGNPQ